MAGKVDKKTLVVTKKSKTDLKPEAKPKANGVQKPSYNAIAALPPSPAPSEISGDATSHSDSASFKGDFDSPTVAREGGAALSDITTPPATPPAQSTTFPPSTDGLDLAGERLLKKQTTKRTRLSPEKTFSARLFDRFGTHDAKLRHQFPKNYAEGFHVFIDGSNVSIGYYNTLKKILNMDRNENLPADFSLSALQQVLERDRPVVKRFIAGSRREEGSEPVYLQHAQQNGYATKVYSRVPKAPTYNPNSSSDSEDGYRGLRKMKMREQGVDEAIHLGMSDSIIDTIGNPGVMVVVTGDANQAEFSEGFRVYTEKALRNGWVVEVYSYGGSASGRWRDPSFLNNEEWAGRVSHHYLDSFVWDMRDPNHVDKRSARSTQSATGPRTSTKKSKQSKFFNSSGYLSEQTTTQKTASTWLALDTPVARPVQTTTVYSYGPPIATPTPQRGFTGGVLGSFSAHTSSQSFTGSAYQQHVQGYSTSLTMEGQTAMLTGCPTVAYSASWNLY
ncbi:hypothetical protein EsH8_VI_000753 [Colletotrichum jinshuiense]